MPQELVAGLRVLNSRYRLIRRLSDNGHDPNCETWLARNEDETSFLLKAWVTGDNPDLVLRAAWDSELRVLYRASSSAGAGDTLLIVREGQFDRVTGAFVLLSEGPGYETLPSQLAERSSCEWLALQRLRQDVETRRDLWRGLRRIAQGVRALHTQQIIHRNVSPESVYLDASEGPATMRLGSFEWSVRVGSGAYATQGPGWSAPPEVANGSSGYTFSTDWYGFGMLLARTFIHAEGWATLVPLARSLAVSRELATTSQLSMRERDFIRRLVDAEPANRLSYSDEILREIDEILIALAAQGSGREKMPLHLVVAASNNSLVEALWKCGFRPNPEDPHQPYSHLDPRHVDNLKKFLREEVKEDGLLFGMGRPDRCILKTRRTTLMLRPYNNDESGPTWDFAHISHQPGAFVEGHPLRLSRMSLRVITPREVRPLRGQPLRSWEQVIPKVDQVSPLDRDLAKFHDFLRCTNQLELLIRDAEICAYEIVSRPASSSSATECIVIRETPRDQRPPADFSKISGGLAEMLQRVLDTKAANKGVGLDNKVFLTVSDSLMVRVDKDLDPWTIQRIDDEDGKESTVTLEREFMPGQSLPPTRGFIRTYGQYAQITLIRRRTDAIERLQEHSYLLRALAQPGQVFMDTNERAGTLQLDETKLDDSKRAVIEDLLRVRPIYALQGPPGTGKTTLVAHLVKEILDDDPVAQILVTAPGHGAVDVLRAKVRDEVFKGLDDIHRPLAVRLGRDRDESVPRDGSVAAETLKLLQAIAERFERTPPASETQRHWTLLIHRLLATATAKGDASRSPEEGERAQRVLADVKELVKRSASITYCTTSAYDLEELASGNHSFDWSIVEEAGKTHGFDLALPLQAGHRWLLLGDQYQLPPYRLSDYRKGIADLDGAVAALQKLPSRGLVDNDWTNRWSRYTTDERKDFQKYCEDRLETFKDLFDRLKYGIFGEARMTVKEPIGAATGRLAVQYRMHPAIGNLISRAFYPDFGGIENATEDPQSGHPKPEILHHIRSHLDLIGKAICWIDLDFCQRNPECRERGPKDNSPKYTNPEEVRVIRAFLGSLDPTDLEGQDLAVLSPYGAQVSELHGALAPIRRKGELTFKQSIQKVAKAGGPDGPCAHTVDSFQGNEADLVVVSLVRNNTSTLGEGLGFLKEDPPRFNVMLSRAQKLLVLVGSWEFFCKQVSLVNPNDETDRLRSVRIAIDEIAKCMNEGSAVRIPASKILALESRP